MEQIQKLVGKKVLKCANCGAEIEKGFFDMAWMSDEGIFCEADCLSAYHGFEAEDEGTYDEVLDMHGVDVNENM